MYKILAKLSILVLILSTVACKSTKKMANAQDAKVEDALLWEISGEGITEPSYLYGTIHMIPKDDYFLPEGTLSAIDKSKKMVFEIDMAEMSDMGKMMGLMSKIFMKDGKTLRDLLDDKDYELVKSHFSDMGLPMMMLEKIKPMFLQAFAYTDMDPGALMGGGKGDSDIKSYEFEFYNIAETKKMETGGLESIEFQISVFDSIPYQDQAKMLVETLKTSDTENDEFQAMIDMYKSQQINAMVSMIGNEESGLGDFDDLLLNKRNQNWIPQIITMAKTQPTFIAVGAGHLAGPQGVINLLRKEGIKIRPVNKAK